MNMVVETEEICRLWQERISKLLPFALKEEKWYYFPCENAQDIMGKRKKYLVQTV